MGSRILSELTFRKSGAGRGAGSAGPGWGNGKATAVLFARERDVRSESNRMASLGLMIAAVSNAEPVLFLHGILLSRDTW